MVDVVEDPDLVLGVVVAVQAPRVLGHRPLPCDGHGEHERVESRVVEALADVAASCKDYARTLRGQQLVGAPASADAHAAVHRHERRGALLEQLRERIE